MNTQDEFSLFASEFFTNNSILKFEQVINFNDTVKQKAKKLSQHIKDNIDYIVNEFYEYNLNNMNAKKHFKNQEEVEQLKKINTNTPSTKFLT